MFKKLLNKFKKRSTLVQNEPVNNELKRSKNTLFSGEDRVLVGQGMTIEELAKRVITRTVKQDMHRAAGDSKDLTPAMDEDINFKIAGGAAGIQNTVPDSLMNWYSAQSFVGYLLSSVFSQHWLVLKCCTMPAEDAVRRGYEITVNDGTIVSTQVLDAMKKADVRYRINDNMREFITKGRMFGIRIAMFKVESPDPKYYENPFNPDGVIPGSYKGISQIDPYWITPELDFSAGADPSSMFFYEPTWWRINGMRVHRTNLIIFRNGHIADILKPTYLYGGIPVPQQIYERVYCAERTANEAPQLAMTKRTNVINVELENALANQADFEKRIQVWTHFYDNYGIKIMGLEETATQLDTSLADLDAVIMTQYQIVAAAAEVPATKLLGTTPKGFNATGEYDEKSYHEKLESLQANHLTELLERHHLLLIRSEIAPNFNIPIFDTTVTWKPVATMSDDQVAALNKAKADTGQVLIMSGAIDAEDERQRIINDPLSGYSGLSLPHENSLLGGDPEQDPQGDPTIPTELEENTQSDPETIVGRLVQ